MKLIIAGYNIDAGLIAELKAKNATPEVISAAYARISRSNKRVDTLRKEALSAVEKARSSNENIIYEMGHASIAEHAVFNLDLIDVSRLLTESVQRSRLASFTEKSQRYVTFSKDYLIPKELSRRTALKQQYCDLMDRLFTEYETSYNALNEYYIIHKADMKPKDRECLAKEDARYILPLATKTQMGITINARSLEQLLRRLATIPLKEALELKELIIKEVKPICPSLIRHTESDGYLGKVDVNKVGFSGFLQQELPWLAAIDLENKARLISAPKNADDQILAALIYPESELSWQDNLELVSRLPRLSKEQLWQQVFTGMKSWHKVPRAFEAADFEFELFISESCWAQFKRHRQCTILKKKVYSGNFLIPEAIKMIGREDQWNSMIKECISFSDMIPEAIEAVQDYLKLNGSICKVYVKMNCRELYHFIRLRSDEHAQWEIREVSEAICKIVKKHAPNSSRMLCGKSCFK
ncbi:MAG: FAD-dependent thymidylate synthase [Candidatus Cloacimonetes bacterium]|jgi:flavin-dependent thymidylate synthase|nr:FAD-dependent thymidylate synthase [Candidatus Cloacimonadota bacterium]MDD2507061.1 FAD-dependent thymidylate synthase [Candidatus Cloacimonadota bacterium]MDD4559837.1 FAD-dependent thymidylate synthase [Candidatus Cloacimonadota bacterium]